MPILPEGRTQNVKASLYGYLGSNYSVTPIQYEGLPFEEENNDEWVRADIVVLDMDYFRQVEGSDIFGADLIVLANMDIMIKPDRILHGNIYRKEYIADELRHLFRIPLSIPVYDHYTGVPLSQIGILRTSELEDVDLGFNRIDAIYGHNVSSTMFYLSKWEGP